MECRQSYGFINNYLNAFIINLEKKDVRLLAPFIRKISCTLLIIKFIEGYKEGCKTLDIQTGVIQKSKCKIKV